MSRSFARRQKAAPTAAGRLYELAVARDTANFIDIDAALALARIAIQVAMAVSPDVREIIEGFAQQEIDRLSLECDEHMVGTIAIIRDAVSMPPE